MLGMDDRASESMEPGDVWLVSLLIIVVAGAEPKKSTGPFFLPVVVFDGHRPQFLPAVPGGVHQSVLITHKAIKIVLFDGVIDVAADGLSVGHGIGTVPRLERETEGIHVGVGANAGITKEVPGASRSLSCLDNQKPLVRARVLQSEGR